MLTKFRNLYPQGSILSELIDIDRGVYIVRVSIKIDGVTLATGLAGAESVEKAEDSARNRALQALVLEDGHLSLNLAPKTLQKVTMSAPENVTVSAQTNHSRQNHSYQSVVVNPPKTSVPQEEVTATVQPQIPQPVTQDSLLSESSAKNTPQPEPKAILEPPQPETPSSMPESTEDTLEPTLELTTAPADFQQVDFEPQGQSVKDTLSVTSSYESKEQQASLTPPEEDYGTAEPAVIETPAEFDFNQIRHKIDLEMKRLSWTKEQGRDYLLSTYGKRSRLHLTDDELLEFWHYLETLPN